MPIAILDRDVLAQNWGAVALRGILALTFGIVTLAAPKLSLLAIVFTFSAYAGIDGVLTLISAFGNRKGSTPWWMLALHGIAGIAIAVFTVVYPGITVVALMYLIAAWSIISGVLSIVAAIRLRELIHNEWLLGLTGVLAIGLGIVVAMYPVQGTLAFVLWLGVYALLSGALLIGLSMRLRHRWHDIEHGPIHRDVAHQSS